MPAKPNRASGKPVPANVQLAALEKQQLEAQKLEAAATTPEPPVDVKPAPQPAETLVADSIDLHLVARKPRGKSLVITIKPGE